MKKNLDIEMLRSVAIMFVLFAHAYNLFPWVPGFLSKAYKFLDLWTGVDLFFCVSGFIITKSYLVKNKNGNLSGFISFSVPFWIKRAWRLWPSAWLWLSVILICSIVFKSSGIWGNFGDNAMYQTYAMLHFANIYGFECRSQHDLQSLINLACGANQIYWSLSLEEQFYFIFPFIAFFINRKYLIPFFIIVFILQFPINRGGSVLGYLRTDAISLGVVIALWSERESYLKLNPSIFSKRRFSIPSFLLILILFSMLGNSRFAAISISTGLVAMVASILVWIASYNKDYFACTKSLKMFAGYIGSRSYTIYLCHIPVFFMTKEIFWRIYNGHIEPTHSMTLLYIITASIMMVVSVELSYRIVEMPLRNKGREFSDRFLSNP